MSSLLQWIMPIVSNRLYLWIISDQVVTYYVSLKVCVWGGGGGVPYYVPNNFCVPNAVSSSTQEKTQYLPEQLIFELFNTGCNIYLNNFFKFQLHRLSNNDNDSQNFENDSTFDDERQSKLPQKLISNSGTFTNLLENVHKIAALDLEER